MSAGLLTRRGFGGMVVAASALGLGHVHAAPPSVPGKRLRFTVLRNGCTIGSHDVSFDAAGDDLVVHIDARMRVGFGPITFFRYHHQGEERWSGGRFISLATQTDNNGEALHVLAQRVAEGIRVEATNMAPAILPGDALPLTHWNVAAMTSRLFNPQDGKLLQAVTTRQGMDVVALGDGQQVKAMRYSMNGKLPIDDWYDQSMVWTALQAKVKDGSTLRYVREA
jgi:hypothetical protein